MLFQMIQRFSQHKMKTKWFDVSKWIDKMLIQMNESTFLAANDERKMINDIHVHDSGSIISMVHIISRRTYSCSSISWNSSRQKLDSSFEIMFTCYMRLKTNVS